MNKPIDPKQLRRATRGRAYKPRFAQYEAEKQAWTACHPGATPAEYQDAMRKIAERCGI